MKKLLLFVAVCFVAFHVEAQSVKKKDIPVVVTQNLEAWYPGASKIKWSMDDGMYVASFLMNDMENEVVIAKDGQLSSAEAEITFAQLPESVQQYLSAHFPNTTFDEIEMEMDAHGLTTYSVETNQMEYTFSAEGTLLSQESDDDGDDD